MALLSRCREKPFALPYFRRRDGRSYRRHAGGTYQYSPLEVASAYGIPISRFSGRGAKIGVIELGGAFSQSDLSAYLHQLGRPDVQVRIAGGNNQQSDPGGADVEVMLDLCIIAALAPGASLTVYFAPNTSAGFAGIVQQAAAENDIVSISWGGPEDQWSGSDIQQMAAIIKNAALAGINVFVAAGDNGSGDGESGTHVDFPASCPYSVACGGTNLKANGATIISETVWNDGVQGGATGGGISDVFAKPPYQAGETLSGTMRGVPDMAGVADPETGWLIIANGSLQSVGGTSAVAPMWAAICALMQEANGGRRVGYVNNWLYQHAEAFFDTITGNNGQYQAGPGYDLVTGMGTPKGPALFSLLPLGTTTSPPPSPPPGGGGSPPPSPPPPPGGGITIQQIQQAINAVFARFEKMFANRPHILAVIKVIQSQIDAALTQLAAAIERGQRIQLDVQIVLVILQRAFAYVEGVIANEPWLVMLLQTLEPWLEQEILAALNSLFPQS